MLLRGRTTSLLLLVIGFFLIVPTPVTFAQPADHNVVGYFTAWSVYGRDYHVTDIPADLITHINYAFANIDPGTGTIMLGDAYADIDKFYPGDSWEPGSLRGSFHQLQILKENHPHLKTLISVGGWTWSAHFSDVALTDNSRQIFAASVMDFITEYEFDGVDIDWEYPVEGGLGSNTYRPEDRENFTLLLAELRDQLDVLEQQHNREYLLTAATAAGPGNIENLELDLIHQYVDWINVMTFDFHGPWLFNEGDPVTNFNAPLVAASDDPNPEPFHSQFNVAAALRTYMQGGVPASKLHMSLPFYGRGFAGVPNQNDGLFQSYTGPSNGTWENGVFDYWDIEQNYENQNNYESHWHNQAKVPWLYNSTASVFISYDNPASIREKIYLAEYMDLGGVMFWEFSGDKYSVLLNEVASTLGTIPFTFTLISHDAQIILPAAGGTFLFDALIADHTGIPHTMQAWLEAVLPNGNIYPVTQTQLTLNPYQEITYTSLSQSVPAFAPAGSYQFRGRLGFYPSTIVAGDRFWFEKTAAQTDESGPSDWRLRRAESR
jgi:chitinase